MDTLPNEELQRLRRGKRGSIIYGMLIWGVPMFCIYAVREYRSDLDIRAFSARGLMHLAVLLVIWLAGGCLWGYLMWWWGHWRSRPR